MKKIGGLILVAAIIIWFLSYYPRPEAAVARTVETESVAAVSPVPESELESSYLCRIGKTCEPVMRPLGLDWRASVALLSGAAAKEIVVSTLGVLYSAEEGATAGNDSLSTRLISSGNYTRASALAMMIFILLYFPCIATVMAIAHEAGGWKYALFSIVYNTLLAWSVAFAAYRAGVWLGM